jgi:Phage integrase family
VISVIDFLRRRIQLHRNAVMVNGAVAVGTLKSNKNRMVVLPQFVVDALAKTARGKYREDLLWPTASGGYLGPPASKESWLSGAVVRCRKADPTFPMVTAHALRHTAASLAISAGANPKVVQRMLGHASAAMTLDVYADLFDSDLTSVAESWAPAVGVEDVNLHTAALLFSYQPDRPDGDSLRPVVDHCQDESVGWRRRRLLLGLRLQRGHARRTLPRPRVRRRRCGLIAALGGSGGMRFLLTLASLAAMIGMAVPVRRWHR